MLPRLGLLLSLLEQKQIDKFNFTFDRENIELMEAYIEKSTNMPKEKHIYTLEDYGLDKKEVHNRLQ